MTRALQIADWRLQINWLIGQLTCNLKSQVFDYFAAAFFLRHSAQRFFCMSEMRLRAAADI